MAITTSGQISINDIMTELDITGETALNDEDVRGLITKGAGTEMSISEWYGASAVSAATYVGSTSADGVSTLNASGISGLATGDTIIFIGGEDDQWFEMDNDSDWNTMFFYNWPEAWGESAIIHMLAYREATSGTNEANIVAAETTTPLVIDAAGMVAFRNLGTPASEPQYLRALGTQGTNTTTQVYPSMTVTEAGSTGILFSWLDDDDGQITTVPSGWTKAFEVGRVGHSICVMYQLNMSVGTTGEMTTVWNSRDRTMGWGYIIPPA